MAKISMHRRGFLKTAAACVAFTSFRSVRPGIAAQSTTTRSATGRDFHASFAVTAFENDPALLATLRDAGINHIWLASFFYGHWPWPMEKIREWRGKIEKAGMAAYAINLGLGHPGDSLGAQDGNFPLTPPKHWKPGVLPNGQTFAGTSLHVPATQENADALVRLQAEGFERVFLDDDFRLARLPGWIGGCFCDEHQNRFLGLHGYAPARWKELLDDVATRRRSRMLDEWIEFTCDDLSGCFSALRRAAPKIDLGPMVMYLGAEKAGIRLSDYAGVPMRVGESMFNDGSFAPIKGKTDELFSALFHRRFVKPELAFSESTAFPSNSLSAANMAAKLNVSTIADVRHTMLMSGLVPVPRTHWIAMADHIKRHTDAHAILAGHEPRGPFKHLWTDDDRRISDDNPYSLFLASGVPFSVCDAPAKDGYTFLSDYASHALASGRMAASGSQLIVRPGNGVKENQVRGVAESMEEMFALKHEIMNKMPDVPVVVEDKPVICAWFPTAHAVFLWNLSDQRADLTLRCGTDHHATRVESLDFALIRV